MKTSARALLEALNEVGVELSAPDGSHLFAKPRAKVSEELAQVLRRFKPELIGALRSAHRNRLPARLVACARCDLDFACTTDRLCPWCKVTEHNFVKPGSCAETDYLNTKFMALYIYGEDGEEIQVKRSRAHALAELPEMRSPSSPSLYILPEPAGTA